MTEIEDILEDEDDEEEDEEEYEALSDEAVIESALNFDALLDIDASKEEDDDDFESFGAFEQKVSVCDDELVRCTVNLDYLVF